jgi:hypothetical protein
MKVNSDQVRQLNNPLTERRRLKRQWPTNLSLAYLYSNLDISGDLSLDNFSSQIHSCHPIYS